MEQPISIVIPAFNQLDYCRQCISSIQRNTTRPYRLILVDNGSTDGVSEYFDSVADAVVVHSETNKGFAAGINMGLEHATGHVLLLNSDTIVPPNWLTRLEHALLQDDTIGIVGPMSNCVSGPQQIDDLEFSSQQEMAAFADNLAETRTSELTDTLRLVGFCMLIRDRLVDEIGGMDESFGIGNYEDDDYCLRATRAGYRLCIAEDCFVFHYGNRTFAGMSIDGTEWDSLLDKNRSVFEDKWTISPEGRLHPQIYAQKLNRKAAEEFQAGDLAKAEALLRESLKQYPRFAMSQNDLGVVLYACGKTSEALAAFRTALEIDPACEEAAANLADVTAALEGEDVAPESEETQS